MMKHARLDLNCRKNTGTFPQLDNNQGETGELYQLMKKTEEHLPEVFHPRY